MKPTPLGVVLVHGYHSIDSELVLPHMRRAVEEQLNHIATGQADFRAVLQFVLALFTTKYRYFVQHIAAMDQLFEVSFSSLSNCGRPLTRCGKCRRYLKLVESLPHRLHCPFCADTYSVPQNGSIRPYKETKCPLDDFELILWTQGAKGKVEICQRYRLLISNWLIIISIYLCCRAWCSVPIVTQIPHSRVSGEMPDVQIALILLASSRWLSMVWTPALNVRVELLFLMMLMRRNSVSAVTSKYSSI